MGMGCTQGTFYFPTTPVECSELPIPLDHQEKNIFNQVIASEEIKRLYTELKIVTNSLCYDHGFFAVTKCQFTRDRILIDYSE